jgi:hypothetical protein
MPYSRLRPRAAALYVLSGLVAVASCAAPLERPSGSPVTPRAAGAKGAAAAADAGAPAPAARPVHVARPAIPGRPPPPRITTAMKGEPTGASLAEARLVATSCEKISAEHAEPHIKEMRVALARSFKEWHDAQPGCWADDRAEYEWRKQQESFGSGGLGLRGVGSGGGGSAEGIGLGSIGTIGHGAGSFSGAAASSGSRGSSGPKAALHASGTNNQIVGVDEADIVKTDGRYVYVAANGALRIIEALDPRIVSVTKVPGSARDLFVEGDRAVVYVSSGSAARSCTYGYDCAFGGDGSTTKVLVFDIANRSEPKLVRQIDLSGSLIAARRIGKAVHTVVADGDAPGHGPGYPVWPKDFEMCGTEESIVRAKFAKLAADNERLLRAKASFSSMPTMRDKGVDQPLCTNVLRTAIRDGQAFTTVVSFALDDDKAPATAASIQSRPGAVFASGDALYLSVVHQRKGASANKGRWYSSYASVDEASEIHKFHIGASPRETRYVGSGIVPGHVLNQFAMDEWYGYLRVATTRGRVPDPKVESAVSILAEGADGNLARIGAIEKIAPGEDIRAVRFDDDRGYVVTFKKTDPLFVLDLYQPSRPAILGELKIPGFSTYLHRIDPEHLLSIGFDANDHGDFAYFDGVILQLFDVKNPTEPKLVHKEKIGTRGSSSEAATDHLAFNYFADQGLLAVPMTICEGGGDGKNGTELAFSGLLVYDVDIERGFTRLGGVDHGTKGASCQAWWSNASSAVKRSVFLDDLVYSIAGDRAKVQRMTRFGHDVADLSFVP